jgi:hypothetical protein
MKKAMILTGWLILICAQVALAQDKIEAPIWSVGDRWIFTPEMTIEVIRTDGNNYVVRFQDRTILFEKSTLNRAYAPQGKGQRRVSEAQRGLLDFPLTIRKKCKDTYLATLQWEEAFSGRGANEDNIIFYENDKVLGWEGVEVQAGKFKAIKVEYKKEWSSSVTGWKEGKAWYWYSPEVKYLVKAEYEKNQIWGKLSNWELTSFHLAK